MKIDIFNVIYNMILSYKETTNEDPYVVLISPKIYAELIEYLKDTNAFRYLSKLEGDNRKINYIFGVHFEKSEYIIQDAIAMNIFDYEKYCEYKCIKNNLFKSEVE